MRKNTKLEQQADLLFANINGWKQSMLERIGKRINKIGKMSFADVQALNNIADVKSDMKEITAEFSPRKNKTADYSVKWDIVISHYDSHYEKYSETTSME